MLSGFSFRETGSGAPGLWTPTSGAASGLLVVARQKSLAVVVGGRIVASAARTGEGESGSAARAETRRRYQLTRGGLVIVSSSRQKEPTRIVGHPDLASGASVQRGEVLYVSVAEAIYRETRGEDVEVHLTPNEGDCEALADLRLRARHRWDSDRLPDGWTRPLPPPDAALSKMPHEKSLDVPGATANKSGLPDDLRELAERIHQKEQDRHVA